MVFLDWFLLLFWVEREETRGDGAYQSLSVLLLLLHEARRFFGKHSHDEDALEFFVSAMDSCMLAIIARLS
jgi:hypothetical protein